VDDWDPYEETDEIGEGVTTGILAVALFVLLILSVALAVGTAAAIVSSLF